MRLFEAIMAANQRVAGGGPPAPLAQEEFSSALPVVALTCIDPRLNRLLPEALGVAQEQFIWLRNAGNILTGPASSTMRSIALACAVKGGKEIAIIGHTDCRVRSISMVELSDRFKALGIERSKLPDNVNEFFGLFASERQNVMKGVDFARQSAIIGPKVPVHGLMIDVQTGRLEWVVNGYDALEQATSKAPPQPQAAGVAWPAFGPMPGFNMGELKMNDTQIGDSATKIPVPAKPSEARAPQSTAQELRLSSASQPFVPAAAPALPPAVPEGSTSIKLDRSALYRILGDDKKVYGPVTAEELERWIMENRVDLKSLAQIVGQKQWRTLESFLLKELQERVHLPPGVANALKTAKDFKNKR
ncbi:MAG: carbonic anhydrase [Verrucomicrobiales bacterium]|nr:carbonic anhydrase [Verrucomicrobiales bacterium]